MVANITAEDDVSNMNIEVPDWKTTQEVVRDWIRTECTDIHVLTHADDTLVLVQRDTKPATELATEGETIVGLSIHADDDFVVQTGVGHETGFDATGEYIGDYATVDEAIDTAINAF